MTLTPQQQQAAAAKRRQTAAANRANGTSVRQQRAAAKAAKQAAATGQPYTPPASTPRPASTSSAPFGGRRRRRRTFNGFRPTPPVPQTPVFATPAPTYRALKLASLASLEETFKQKLAETGINDEQRAAWATYKKVKALALGTTNNNIAMQNEADLALRMATIALVKLTY
jgi:hypothetical protein